MEPSTAPEEWVSPRVIRTKEHVLSAAREILLEQGADALTYTALSKHSSVTRQTLYKHWPTRQQLITDVIMAGPDIEYPAAGLDARTVITEFLTSLRDGLSDAGNAAAFLAVATEASHDRGSSTALDAFIADRNAALNSLLADTTVRVGADDYSLLTGPILMQVLFTQNPATADFIARTVDAWLTDKQ